MADRPKGFGMTAELQEKRAAKYDTQLDSEVRQWLEEVTGEPFPNPDEGSDGFHQGLKDGQYLCKAVNSLAAVTGGKTIKFNTSTMAFKQMENIGKFLDFCNGQGVPKTDMFQTVDLYEAQNIPQVMNGIVALARTLRKHYDDIPDLGPKESTQNKREFTQEQLDESKKVISLQMGTNTGASQSGMSFGQGRQIH